MGKITPTFYGQVKDGKLVLDYPDYFKSYIRNLNGRIMLVLRRPKKPRSLNENNYYWGVIIQMISDETGMTPEETHEALKWKFLRKQVGNIFTVKSTAVLDTVGFEEYLMQCRVFAQTELNINVPLPNEVEIN